MKKQYIAIGVAAVLAVLGVVALVIYANRADNRALEGTEMVEVLRATAEIPANTPVGGLGERIELVEVPKVALVPGAVNSLDGLDGLVTKSGLVPGDQLTQTKFAKPEAVDGVIALPKGMQDLAITIEIDGPRFVGGIVAPGDLVGVYASYNNETANPINGLLVLDVQRATAAVEGKAATPAIVHLAVNTLTAEQIVHIMEYGQKIWFTKQNKDTNTNGGETISSKDIVP